MKESFAIMYKKNFNLKFLRCETSRIESASSKSKHERSREDSVADPGCLSRIRIFPILDIGSRVKKIPDPDPHHRI
jgi:hypothetical protein